ncbi:hypothetical protein [Jiella sonneratiae]|uniref:Sulfotransferase family protein n=1 Tax=Jiella sonneratiae TaxID=2816856 RepID=A0ABS3J1H4_9HYPH|nr:hypothetical protein [Jiella sonneratiae]MBO0903540.1 hypothetical protein [Jiella sonneratiae]
MMADEVSMQDRFWQEARLAVQALVEETGDVSVSLPAEFDGIFDRSVAYGVPADVVLLHKGMMSAFPLSFLAEIAHWDVVFANPVFLLLTRRRRRGGLLSSRWNLRREFLERRTRAHLRSYVADVASARFSGRQTVFLHVPKTAGTSIFEAAQGRFHRSLRLRSDSELLSAAGHLYAYDFVAGHFRFDHAESLLPDAAFVTLLRDPLERLVSAAGHARRPGETAARLAHGLRLLRSQRLKQFIATPYGTAALFIQNGIVGGKSRPLPAVHLERRIERIAAGTIEGMAGFLDRNRTLLRIDKSEIGHFNATRNRSTLVSQEEIEEARAAHQSLIEEAGELYRMVRARELAGTAGAREPSSA